MYDDFQFVRVALKHAEIARKLRELEDLQLTEYLQGGPVYVTAEPRSS